MQEKNKEFSIIKQRILQYLEYKDISKYRCYAETGISNNVLSQPNGINEENLLKFINTYRDIDLAWLFFGESSMIIEEKTENNLHYQKMEIQQKIPEITPEFLLKRYEELVVENSELKKKLSENKKNEMSGLPALPPTPPITDVQTELKIDGMQTNIPK